MDVLGAAAAGRRVDAAAVDSSFTFHKLSNRGPGAGIQKPRIRPRRSALPVTSLMPDWHPLKVTRLVWQDMEKRSNAVNQPSASLKLENIGLSWRKIAWLAMWRNDEILLLSTNASRVAASSRRTLAFGKSWLSLEISSECLRLPSRNGCCPGRL